jgi:glycosyltransferase involved in cell wall biosynthesis
MKKTKILQVIGGGEFGGAERHLLTLMRLLDRELFSPVLLCLCEGPFAEQCRAEGIETHEIIMRHKLDLATVKPIRQLIESEGIDLVHTHGVRANLVARTASRQAAVPVVTTFHSMLRYDYQSRWEAYTARILTLLTNGKTDCFIAVSRAIKEDLIRMGVPEAKITVIYNGLDQARLSASSPNPDIKEQLQIDPGKRVLAVVGRLHSVKGQSYFLEAAQLLLPRFPDLLFLLIGEGPDRPAIEQKIKDLKLEQNVFMTGFYPRMNDLYPAIDILCMPSLMEGLPFVLLEAMSFGIPVIASRVGGIPEIVRDKINGLLVSSRDSAELARAMSELLSDRELAARLAANGRETVQEFTLTNMARKTEAVYQTALKRNQS